MDVEQQTPAAAEVAAAPVAVDEDASVLQQQQQLQLQQQISGSLTNINQFSYTIRPQYQQKFKVQTVQRILRETVAEKLTGVQYAAEQCAELTKELTDEVRDKLKALNLPRYKFVVTAVMGEMKGEGARMGARCLWDQDTDNYAHELFINDTLFCTVAAFGVYYY